MVFFDLSSEKYLLAPQSTASPLSPHLYCAYYRPLIIGSSKFPINNRVTRPFLTSSALPVPPAYYVVTPSSALPRYFDFFCFHPPLPPLLPHCFLLYCLLHSIETCGSRVPPAPTVIAVLCAFTLVLVSPFPLLRQISAIGFSFSFCSRSPSCSFTSSALRNFFVSSTYFFPPSPFIAIVPFAFYSTCIFSVFLLPHSR